MNTVTKSVWRFIFLVLISLPAGYNLADSGEKQVWALSIHNDLFTPGNRDADFTGGMALTYSGGSGKKYWEHFDNVLATIDLPFSIGKIRHYPVDSGRALWIYAKNHRFG